MQFKLKRRVSLSIAAVLLLVLGGTACSPGCQPGAKQAQEKRLNLAMPSDIKGFDPVFASGDAYTSSANALVYEPLYQYHYLKRPYEVVPLIAADMPTVSDGGRTYTISIKKGVHFTDDAAFADAQSNPNGTGREVVATDFIYAIKRLADSKSGSIGWWLLDGRIAGLDAFHQSSQGDAPVDYDQPVAGLKALDRYTLQIRLTRPYPQLIYALAMLYTAATAREAVEFYKEEFFNHPVGTGPFKLEKWRRSSRISFVKNPRYRTEFYPRQGEPDDAARGLLQAAGKPLPFVDRVVYHIYLESQPMWLNFVKGQIDISGIPKDNYDQVIGTSQELVRDWESKGIQLWKRPSIDITFTAFNMEDPVLGKHRKVRQAMSLAYDNAKRIELFYNDRALSAQSPIPPGVKGYDRQFRNPYQRYDVDAAKRLLTEAGFPKGKGLPTFTFESVASTTSRQMDELFVREMASIGVKVKVNANTWNEFSAKIHKRQAQIYGIGWNSDYPDAENNLALLYSANASPGPNGANYSNPEYDRLYEKARVMSDSPERTALYRKMRDIAVGDAPWIFGVHRIGFALQHGWVKNYKPHDLGRGNAKYYDIDLPKKDELKVKL